MGRPGSRSSGQKPGVLLAFRPNMIQQRALAEMKVDNMLGYINKIIFNRSRNHFISPVQHL